MAIAFLALTTVRDMYMAHYTHNHHELVTAHFFISYYSMFNLTLPHRLINGLGTLSVAIT